MSKKSKNWLKVITLIFIIIVSCCVLFALLFWYAYSDELKSTYYLGGGKGKYDSVFYNDGSYYYLNKNAGIYFNEYGIEGNVIFKVFYRENRMQAIDPPIILPQIEKMAFDSSYIIASQNFDFERSAHLLNILIRMDSIYYYKGVNWEFCKKNPFYDSLMYKKYNSGIFLDKHQQSFIKEIKKNYYFLKLQEQSINYWIIDKKRDFIYGPLMLKRFNKIKDSLHVNLILGALPDD